MYINPPWFTKKHPKHTKIGRFGKSGKLKCQCQMVGMRYVIVPREGILKKTRRDGSELTFQPINNESFPRVQPVNPPNLLSAPRFAGGPWQVLNESLRTVVQYVIQANFATKFEHDSNKMSRMIQTIIRKNIQAKIGKNIQTRLAKMLQTKLVDELCEENKRRTSQFLKLLACEVPSIWRRSALQFLFGNFNI